MHTKIRLLRQNGGYILDLVYTGLDERGLSSYRAESNSEVLREGLDQGMVDLLIKAAARVQYNPKEPPPSAVPDERTLPGGALNSF